MNKKQAKIIFLLSLAAFFLCFTLSGRVWTRLDLTKNKAYTISEFSRNLFTEITDQIRVTYFVSGILTAGYPLPGEIADFIREYAARSRGKIRFVERDPAGEGLGQVVEDLGIMPQQIPVAENNESTLASVYSGILIEYLDRAAVIPLVFSPETLEYDLGSRIKSLLGNSARVLGVISGDAHKQWDTEYRLLNRELFFAGFQVLVINARDRIPEDLPALFVLGGAEDLDEFQLFEIDRYIAGGGSVLFAADGVFVDTGGRLEARVMKDSGLLAMLANYGAVMRHGLAHDVSALNFTYRNRDGVIETVQYPQWISVQARGGNPDHPVTSRFSGLDLYWASPLELNPPPGVTGEILFSTTVGAWLETENFETSPVRLSAPGGEEAAARGIKILGVSLEGVFPGAFRDRPKEFFEAYAPPGFSAREPERGKKASRIIVTGDADFAGALMEVSRGEARNLDFLLRAAEWLYGNDGLLAIRGREAAGRLDRVTDPGTRAGIISFSRLLNTVFIPLGIIFAGLFMTWKRKKKGSVDL